MFRNELTEAAAYQLSLDYACEPQDFFGKVNIAVRSQLIKGRREIKDTPSFFSLATMGDAAVASVDEKLLPFAENLLKAYEGAQLFTGKAQYLINSELKQFNKVIGGVNIYYLPQTPYFFRASGGFNLRIYDHDDIVTYLYGCKGFTNALMYDDSKPRRDMLAVVGINNNSIIGMAGASSDSERFWQIGIDVVRGVRGMGLATELVSLLTQEVFNAGAIPYYGTWDGNIASQNVARKSGYYPVWAEMFTVDID